MGVLKLKVGGAYTDVVQGPAGPIGPQGVQGIQGVQGPAGSDAPSKHVTLLDTTLVEESQSVSLTGVNSSTYPVVKFYISQPTVANGYPALAFNGLAGGTAFRTSYAYSSNAGSALASQPWIFLGSGGANQPGSRAIEGTIITDRGFATGQSLVMDNTFATWAGALQTLAAVTSIQFTTNSASSTYMWPVGTRFLVHGVKI